MSVPVLGWDIGGANIKVARADGDSRRHLRVLEQPFPIWRAPSQLEGALRRLGDAIGPADRMGLTMTAELADCFGSKAEGVAFVLAAFTAVFPTTPWLVFCTDGRFRNISEAVACPDLVAAANWMASATIVARSVSDALFVDVGSTTTDIIPIVGGQVAARGRTDPERLTTGELVYTGALRTPVCAILRFAPFRGETCRVAAEHFAIAADAHLWLGGIDEGQYRCDTPDGRGVTRDEAASRLARVMCADRSIMSDAEIDAVARAVVEGQIADIRRAMEEVLSRTNLPRTTPVVLAGSGAFLARSAASSAGLSTCDLADEFGDDAARSLPAAAVALLIAEHVASGARASLRET